MAHRLLLLAAVKAKTEKSKPSAAELAAAPDAIESAKAAGLQYVTDERPGIRRQRKGEGFVYQTPAGKPVKDPAVLSRISKLVIPPAWTDVWICPLANGHLQVTGRDARGRKQYRYHERWRVVRDETKYGQLLAFARALPVIRRKVRAHLRLPAMPREKILATVVQLLETTFIRIGNERYARENGSFGLTTLRNKHVRINGKRLEFSFRGKSGKQHHIELVDERLARIVRRCRDLPGYELFQYVDEDGQPRSITSSDVNDYLREITGQDYTAKEFRTWAGTLIAATALQETEFSSESEAKSNIARAIEAASKKLGNTPAMCRKCYIHPGVIEAYVGKSLVTAMSAPAHNGKPVRRGRLRAEEEGVVRVLKLCARAELRA